MRQQVSITAVYAADGQIKPYRLRFADGRALDIESVRDVRRGESLKHGEPGTRYTCSVSGVNAYLFEADGKWYIQPIR